MNAQPQFFVMISESLPPSTHITLCRPPSLSQPGVCRKGSDVRVEERKRKCPPQNNCPINCLSMNTVIVHIREIIQLIAQELAEPEKIN